MKKIFDLLVVLFFGLLIFCCQQRPQNEWYKYSIRDYLYKNYQLQAGYQPMDFRILDNAFFQNNQLISNSLKYVAASFRKELQLSSRIPELADTVNRIQPLGSYWQFADLADRLSLHRQLEVEAKRKLPDQYHHSGLATVINQVNQELDALNEYLSYYNLSIYHTDLDQQDSLLVYHKFRIGANGETETYEMLFELDKHSERVLVEKLLGNT